MHTQTLNTRQDTPTLSAKTRANPASPTAHHTLLRNTPLAAPAPTSPRGANRGVRTALIANPELTQTVQNLASAAETTIEHLATRPAPGYDLILCDEANLHHLTSNNAPNNLIIICHTTTIDTYELALQHRASRVVQLPQDSEWLLAHLIERNEKPHQTNHRTIGVLGGSAGAGASCAATVMAHEATHNTVLLIDTDPLAGGIDLLCGIEAEPGLRWHDLNNTDGRLPATTLRDALPHSGKIATLSFGREPHPSAWGNNALPIIETLAHSVELCIIDLARQHELMPSIASVCDDIFVIVPRQVRALAATMQLLDNDAMRHLPLQLITRSPAPTGISPDDVAASLGRTVIADINLGTRGATKLNHALDLGIGPTSAAGRGRHSLRNIARHCTQRAGETP